jgi:hypothetical protein
MDFFLVFWTAWTNSFTKDHILQAFESTGVWPMDLEPVLKKVHPSTTEDQEDPEFEQLEKVSSWKNLQRLYNKAVLDKSSKEAKSLASSLYYLSTQFELKSAEKTGLRTSLKAKRSTRSRLGLPLVNKS